MSLLAFLIALVDLAGPTEPVDFDTQLVAIFTRAGCNAGSCHGGAAGRGGFKLSLLGSDPGKDYRSIVREFEGRRINPVRPEESLLLAKPTGMMDHGGDLRLEPDGPGARLIEAWIRAGAPRLRLRRLEKLVVEPAELVAERLGVEVRPRATAHFDDGSRRDVTRWTVFTANDPAAVSVDAEGDRLTILRRGQHIVLARHLSEVVAVRITVPLSERPVDLSGSPRRNFIDDHILDTLRVLRIPPAPPADDPTFLRRARLRLTGTLPSSEDVRDFLASPHPDRRSRLIDRLLASPEFTDYWTFELAKLLRIRSLPGDRVVARSFHAWLRRQVAGGTPFDVFSRALITAEGDSHERGEAGFHRMTATPREQAEYVSEVFLSTRLKCANCHDHPLDHWTQDDYHGLAAVFAAIDRGRVVRFTGRGDVTHPRTGKPAVQRIPGERFLEAGDDGRKEFARWLTRPGNAYFARAIVNRLWKALMGRALVEPVDDLRSTNPATHPGLLEHLARDFVENGHDIRHTLRLIAGSAAFARGPATNGLQAGDDRFHSRALVTPMDAEVLADAIAGVTGIAEVYGEYPAGTRAITLPDPLIPSESLDVLGRCARQASCAGKILAGTGLATRLHLLNGPFINRRISSEGGRLARLIASGRSDEEIFEEFYVRALGRYPGKSERGFWREQLQAAGKGEGRRQALEDFVWSLLSCREFVSHH